MSTFQNLCEVARFGDVAAEKEPADIPLKVEQAPPVDHRVPAPRSAQGLTANINISLEIPAVEKPEIYEELFRSMASHLGALMAREE